MRRSSNWRLILQVVGPPLVLLSLLYLYISRPLCAAQSSCVRGGVVGTAVLLTLYLASITIYLSEKTLPPVRQLTDVVRRIHQGDTTARLLTQQTNDVGTLIRAFNDMQDGIAQRIVALKKRNRRLQAVLENMSDGVIITNDVGQVRLVNPAAIELLKVSKKNVLDYSLAGIVRHHQIIDMWQQCRETGQRQIQTIEVSAKAARNLFRKPNKAYFLQVVITPYHAKEARGYLVIIQDLTAVHRLQTVRRDFISNISHELRTPLASLRIITETLQDSALDDPPVAQHFLKRAAEEVDVMTQMVEELLELARIESGRVPLRIASVEVATLFLSPLNRLSKQAGRNEVELLLDLPAGLPQVMADKERVEQVIMNLVYNAIKFTPAGGTISIQAELAKETDEIIFSVADTGIGIPKGEVPRVFERFYKSDRARTRNREGTGLGLSISRHLVEAHNGRIWVKSKENKGSTFFFTLPIAATDVPVEA